MAIMMMSYNNGIFYTRAESNFTLQDATVWLADLKDCATRHHGHVIALLDLAKTSRIAPTAYILIADAVRAHYVSALVCVSGGTTVIEALKNITAMTDRQRIHTFDSADNARLFAEVVAHNTQAAYA
jgi:hypothetical protein